MAEIQVRKDDDRATVTVSGELTVRHARELRNALLDAITTAAGIEVVLGEIIRVDSSFPQLLCSAHRAAESLDKPLTVSGADQPLFADLLRRGGFIRRAGSRDAGRSAYPWLRGPAAP